MSINYRIIKSPLISNCKGYQVRPVITDYVDENYLARSISQSTSFSSSDVIGLIEALCHEINTAIYQGKLVRLRKLGTIKATIATRKAIDGNFNSSSVYLKGINLTWSREFKKELQSVKFIPSYEFRGKIALPESERIENIISEANSNGMIYMKDIASMNKCCFRTACNDIAMLRQQGVLSRVMRGLYKLSDK